MGDVIDFEKYRRERLGADNRNPHYAFMRRSRPRPRGSGTVSGSDLSAELRRLLLE